MMFYRLNEILREGELSDSAEADLLRLFGEAEVIAKLQLVEALLERLEYGKPVGKEFLRDLRRDLWEELEDLWKQNPLLGLTYETKKVDLEVATLVGGETYEKIRKLMKTAKEVEKKIPEEDRADFRSSVENIIADVVSYILGEEATITVDIDNEKVTIRKEKEPIKEGD